jgi:two-component system NarL family sensor kinase
VVYDLRPLALDGMGLVGAVREYAALLSRDNGGAALTVSVESPQALGELPAAVEVAAYRIAAEALTNVVRHSTATTALVCLTVEETGLRIEVCDNGVNAEAWRPGVGLTSMRERTVELGGAWKLCHDGTGGRVTIVLPLAHVDHSAPITTMPGQRR